MKYKTKKIKSFKLRTFQVKDYSWKILKMLEEKQISVAIGKYNNNSVIINCYPFYNGRERSFCITIYPDIWYDFNENKTQLNIVFGEHRSSDSIFVDVFDTPRAWLNPITVDDFSDVNYDNRKYFKYNEFEKATNYILDCIINKVNFINSNIKED